MALSSVVNPSMGGRDRLVGSAFPFETGQRPAFRIMGTLSTVALILFVGVLQALAAGQVPGFAEIIEPGPGQAIGGIFPVFGTATHPAFESYELAFGFDPDPTDTWFPIGEPLDTRVVDGRLAIWDTTTITDGEYRLRLRVSLDGAAPLEAVIGGIRVRNYTPTETPEVAATAVAPTAESTPEPIAAGEDIEIEQPPEALSAFDAALRIGVLLGVIVMFSLAAYVWLSPRVREYAGYLRMRKLHQRQDRARQRGRRE